MRCRHLLYAVSLTLLAAHPVTAQAQPFAVTPTDWHWYEVVDVTEGVTWDQANAAATLAGGYLATIQSQAEDDFIFSLIDDSSHWFQDTTTAQWNGPWTGGFRGGLAPGWGWNNLEPSSYANWSAGFPSNIGATDRIQFGGGAGRTKTWCNAPKDKLLKGFVVEYSGATAKRTLGLITDEPGSSGAYTLVAQNNDTETYLVDSRGRVVNQWSSQYLAGISTGYMLENGNMIRGGKTSNPFLTAGGRGGILQEFDWDGNIVWEYEFFGPTFHQHHDFQPLPNGNVLIIAWEIKTESEAIAAGRDPNLLLPPRGGDLSAPLQLWPDMVVEVQPTPPIGGNIVWEWHAWDHLIQDSDATKANFGVVEDHPELIDMNYVINPQSPDWMHCNSIDYNAALDQIMISVNFFDEIWIIDHSTTTLDAAGHTGGRSGKGGDLLYRWGNPRAYRAGIASDQRLYGQHDAHWIDPGLPGAGNILVFNNGANRPGGEYSSADEIVPPAVDGGGNYPRTGPAWGPSVETASYFPRPQDFFSRRQSGAQRMPNGNTALQGGFPGNVFELDSQGRTIWEYEMPVVNGIARQQGMVTNSNRFFRAPQYTADFPGFVGKTLDPGEPVEVHPSVVLVEGSTAPYRAMPGEDVSFSLRAEDHPLKIYLAGTSATEGVIPIGLRHVRLGLDPLLSASIGGQVLGTFQNYLGVLNVDGRATATLAIPPNNGLIGMELDTAFVVLDFTAVNGIGFISNTVCVSITTGT